MTYTDQLDTLFQIFAHDPCEMYSSFQCMYISVRMSSAAYLSCSGGRTEAVPPQASDLC